MKTTRWVVTYILVASLGLWGALFMSLKFITPGRAQTPEAPSAGDLPPEFLQETQIPPPPNQPPDQGPPPSEALPPTMDANLPGGAPPMVPSTGPGGEILQPLQESVPIVPQFASDEQYTYDPTGRRDPFRPYRTYRPPPNAGGGRIGTEGGSVRIIDETDPLQRWDLDRFAVVAIMWEVRQPKAMIQDPDGKMYMVGKKTKIGRNSGQVVAIREGEVVVVEEVDNEGVQTKEVKILELKK